MKYIFFYGAREPVAENTRKAYDVEKKRIERGESWGDDTSRSTRPSSSWTQTTRSRSPSGWRTTPTT